MAPAGPGPWSPSDLGGWVASYDAEGWHRTGSPADRRHAQWLINAVGRPGPAAREVLDELVETRVRPFLASGRVTPGPSIFERRRAD